MIIQPHLTKILSKNKARLPIKYYSGKMEKVDHVLKLVAWVLDSDWIGCSLFISFLQKVEMEVLRWFDGT